MKLAFQCSARGSCPPRHLKGCSRAAAAAGDRRLLRLQMSPRRRTEYLKVDKDVSSNEIFVSILGQNLYFILSQPTVAHIQLDRCARLRIRLLVVCRVSTDLAGPTNAGIAAVQFAFLINSTHQAFYCAYTETKAPQARATTAWRADGDEGFALVRFNCDFPTQLSHTKRVIAGQNRLSKR